MQTKIVHITDLIVNYLDNSIETVKEHIRFDDIKEAIKTLQETSAVVEELSSTNALRMLTSLFKESYTIMLLNDYDLDELEQWYHQGIEWCVLVKDKHDKLMAAFTPNQINW